MRIILTKSDYQCLSDHASACWPEEACALLIGEMQEGTDKRVQKVVLSNNIANDPLRYFEIDPAVRIATEKEIRAAGTSLLGVFHTHPDGVAKPSRTDEKMIYEKSLSWLVGSASQRGLGALNAFHPADDSGFISIELILE